MKVKFTFKSKIESDIQSILLKRLYKVVHWICLSRGAAHSICNLRYKVPQEILLKIHNGSKYGFHFIIRELVEEFKGQFECLGENTEKIYYLFSTN